MQFTKEELTKEYIACNKNITKLAEILGIHRSSARNLLKKHGIYDPEQAKIKRFKSHILDKHSLADIKKCYQENSYLVATTARKLGVDRSTLKLLLIKHKIFVPVTELAGQLEALETEARKLPNKGKIKRYILTCAQNNTKVNKAVWDNLQAIADYYKAEILVASFNYNLNAYGKLSVKHGTSESQEKEWFDPIVEPYLAKSDKRIKLAPTLTWCGEMNISPTAENPLSGFEGYTKQSSGIFPHAKIAMESIPTAKDELTKINYTTGAVTQINYIQKKAGLKAEFHHCYGGLLVEVDHTGTWFVRQLNADKSGKIYDLGIKADNGKVTEQEGHIEAINWGDVHAAKLEPWLKSIAWDKGGILDQLKPKYQFMHDTLDFYARNHHETKNCHAMFLRHIKEYESVELEIKEVADLLGYCDRDFCTTVVVDSNHDNALERWLREADYKTDPVNAIFFLECQLAKYKSLAANDKNFHLMEYVLKKMGVPLNSVFLTCDESFTICEKAAGGIECGMHGHLGPNGARGNPRSFKKMGKKLNIGHMHSAGIVNGVYVAGVLGSMDMGYNKGPSSWSHSQIITYENGKRAIVTFQNNKWRH